MLILIENKYLQGQSNAGRSNAYIYVLSTGLVPYSRFSSGDVSLMKDKSS